MMNKLFFTLILISFLQLFANDYTKAMLAYENSDYKEAIVLLKALSDKGHARAQFNLATLYDGGYGVEIDQVKAVKWYKKAALQNHTNAQHLLSLSYCLGSGVLQDFKKCAFWAKKVKKSGFDNSEVWNEFELWEYK